jgi:oligosaccharyl transferase (archaeosortase A-associated)
MALSLVFRVALPYDSVFTGGWVKFTSNDAYFHMRLVDNLVHNFPHLTHFDPYFIYPGGGTTSGVHFFDYLLAIIIWIIGLGSPTQHTIDVVGAYFPAVLAALTVIPVFFIGKALFNRWVGVMAAFLTALLPGEFLGRSILAFTDNHVAETFFSTLAVLFFILAVKPAVDGLPITLENLLQRDWKTVKKTLLYSALAGLFLGIYLSTWMGALLFVFIISVFFVLQFIINHFRHKPNDHLGIIGFVTFLIADIIFLPQSPDRNFTLVMLAALFIPPVLAVISRLMSNWKVNTIYYPLSLIAVGGVLLGIVRGIDSSAITTMWHNFLYIFAPGGGSSATTTMEMQPFLSPTGSFTTIVAWGNFTTSFFMISPNLPIAKLWWFPGFAIPPIAIAIWLWTKQRINKYHTLILFSFGIMLIAAVVFWFITPAGWKFKFPGFGIISLLILIVLSIKQRGQKEIQVFFVIWTLIILIATLVQRRFAYYLVVNMAVLSAYISWEIIWYAGLRRLTEKADKDAAAEKAETKAKAKKKRRQSQGVSVHYVYTVVAIIVVFFCVDFFNISQANNVASTAPYAPTDGWEQALTWMKTNTPEPLGDPGAYYKLFNTEYKYPASAYGVTAWWDYGYWISRIAERLPSTNPSQASDPIKKVATLFLSQNATSADKIMADLGSSYIIADNSLIAAKIWAVVDWASQSQDKYFGTYFVPKNGSYQSVQLYNPNFYRTLIVRLYSFDGKAVPDGKPVVVTYTTQTRNGAVYKLVTAADQYPTYQAALNYIASQKSGNYDIVGTNPFISPVPLDAIQDFNIVYSSPYTDSFSGNVTLPDIKVFEHVK